ncbi:MAG: GNAT family N-acetyltransferase [Aeromicrobium erythreum]
MAVSLRRYRLDDAAATSEVFVRAVRQTASRDYDAQQVDAWVDARRDLVAWAVARQAARTVVAERDGRVVGFTDVDDTGYVDMLFVDPDVAGQGVASLLLDHVETQARTKGVQRLSAHASITAAPVFVAKGFTVEQERNPVLGGVRFTNFLVAKSLEVPGTAPATGR